MSQYSGSTKYLYFRRTLHKKTVLGIVTLNRRSNMNGSQLLSLPRDILVLLPDFLHNVEDYANLSSSCTALRDCMETATPNTILRLAVAQSKVFFRPSPHFLVAATARELGNWARRSDVNEKEFALKMQDGVGGLLNLALDHCGLTMERLRELHLMRFSIINPIVDIIDKCVGEQWYSTPNFWDGGVDDAYTIQADPPETLFHLAIYGELFAPDFEIILNKDQTSRRLSVETRLEFIKYCVPDFACEINGNINAREACLLDGTLDPRRAVQATGPYAKTENGSHERLPDNNIALTWVLRSTRWRPHWKEFRMKAGPDFQDEFDDGWWYDEHSDQDWRQRMWETVIVCQGLDGLSMVRPALQDRWIDKVKEWRENISKLEREPATKKVGRQATLEYPFLLGDLRICASGYVLGT